VKYDILIYVVKCGSRLFGSRTIIIVFLVYSRLHVVFDAVKLGKLLISGVLMKNIMANNETEDLFDFLLKPFNNKM
jgi:hypothetical protein